VIQVIEGKSIDLKIIDKTDIEQLREWRNSKEVADYMISRPVISKEQQEKWYDAIKNDPSGMYWVILSKEKKKLGLVSLTKIDRTDKSAEPGLYIGTKQDRNSFSGMEAYYYVLDYAFTTLGLEKIYGTTLSMNKVAQKMNISFGFITEGIVKDGITLDGVNHDLYKVVLYPTGFYASSMAKFFSGK
jgi:UDP-4-amino-4,6-dideoxy-N-acetyl-beta-L-altrosamine N-acetyltransferase